MERWGLVNLLDTETQDNSAEINDEQSEDTSEDKPMKISVQQVPHGHKDLL